MDEIDYRRALEAFEGLYVHNEPYAGTTPDDAWAAIFALRDKISQLDKAKAEAEALARGEAVEVRGQIWRHCDGAVFTVDADEAEDPLRSRCTVIATFKCIVPLPKPIEIEAEVSDGE